MIGIKMLQQRLLIEESPESQTTTAGLFVPDTIAKNLGKGKIVAVGESKLRSGDTVIFDRRQALPITLEEKEYLILHEPQVIAVLSKKRSKGFHNAI